MHREAQEVNHQGHMDNAAADAEDTGEKAHYEAGSNAPELIKGEAFRQSVHVHRRLAAAVHVHHRSHEQQENTEVEVEHGHIEIVHDIGAEEGAGQGGNGKGNCRLEIHALLFDIGKCSRQSVCHDNDEGCAGNLGSGFKKRM